MEDQGMAGGMDAGISRRNLAIVPLGMASLMALPATGAGRELPDRPSLEERAAIEDLFTTYVWSYDCSDSQLFLSLFVEDDPLVVGMGKAHRGKQAMADWFAYLLNIREKENALWLHQAAHHHYRRQGANWLVYSYATHFAYDLTAKGYVVRSLGYFVSELVAEGKAFRFRRFSISHWDKSAVPWARPLPWAEADGLASAG